MEKLLLLFLLFPTIIFSQTFTATVDGLVDSENMDKSYVIIRFEDKTTEELYDLTNKFCQKHYVSPKNALQSDIKNEYLKIKTFAKNFILLQEGMFGEGYYANITYAANFSFKENKVKFEITEAVMAAWDLTTQVLYKSSGGLTWSIYKSNGKPRKDFNIQYQDYFNKYIADYISFINEYKKNNDNW